MASIHLYRHCIHAQLMRNQTSMLFTERDWCPDFSLYKTAWLLSNCFVPFVIFCICCANNIAVEIPLFSTMGFCNKDNILSKEHLYWKKLGIRWREACKRYSMWPLVRTKKTRTCISQLRRRAESWDLSCKLPCHPANAWKTTAFLILCLLDYSVIPKTVVRFDCPWSGQHVKFTQQLFKI